MVTGNYEVIKTVNISLVLSALRIHGNLSRSDLSRITSLTSGTITNLTQQLLELNLIKELGTNHLNTGGRKPVILSLNEKGAYAFAVDVKTNGIEVRLVDFTAQTIETITKSGAFTVEDATEIIIDAVNTFKDKYYLKKRNLLGMGLSLPGWIDYQIGNVIKLPNLPGWENYPLKKELEDALDLPIYIDNDANLSALGELWFGKGKTFNHMISIFADDGIGAGFIINEQLYRGIGTSVGEFGHITIAPPNNICTCGKKGCLDTVASATSMVRTYKELTGKDIDFEEFVELTNSQDSQALNILNDAARYLGIGISILINLFHPSAIIFGGKLIHSISGFLPLVKQHTIENTLAPMLQDIVILSSENKNSSILGAVALVFQSTLQPYFINSNKSNKY